MPVFGIAGIGKTTEPNSGMASSVTDIAKQASCDTACSIIVPCAIIIAVISFIITCYKYHQKKQSHSDTKRDSCKSQRGGIVTNPSPRVPDEEDLDRTGSGKVSSRSSLSVPKPAVVDVQGTRYSDVPSLAPPSTERLGTGSSDISAPNRLSMFFKRSSSLFPFPKASAPKESTTADPLNERDIDLEAGPMEMKNGSVMASTIGNAR